MYTDTYPATCHKNLSPMIYAYGSIYIVVYICTGEKNVAVNINLESIVIISLIIIIVGVVVVVAVVAVSPCRFITNTTVIAINTILIAIIFNIFVTFKHYQH